MPAQAPQQLRSVRPLCTRTPAPPHGPFNAKQGTALCKLPAQGSNLTGGGF